MKRFIVIFLVIVLSFSLFSGCVNNKTEKDTGKLSIVTTIFPQYDFARQIAGDKADITLLLPPGSESHSYEPTPQDIIKIQNCDLFIYVGGENDTWVDGILDSMDVKVKTLTLMECVDAVEEETVEGMESEKEEESKSGEIEYDEHVWTAPANAIKIVNKLTSVLSEIDSNNNATYKSNSEAYVKELTTLDNDFKTLFSKVTNKTLIFGDRFPLRYFADEFGLKYYAAFPGCSDETEPSAGTVAFLIDKVKSENIGTVFYIELSNQSVVNSISEATGAKTALFHSCHNLSTDDFAKGATYLSLMRQNLATLTEALK